MTATMTLRTAPCVFRHNQNGYHTLLVAKYLEQPPAGIDKTPKLAPPCRWSR